MYVGLSLNASSVFSDFTKMQFTARVVRDMAGGRRECWYGRGDDDLLRFLMNLRRGVHLRWRWKRDNRGVQTICERYVLPRHSLSNGRHNFT